MDIGVTISKVRKEYREYLRETHPDWADPTISTHVSDAFYLYQNTIALSFWKCFESDASMEKAKGEIFDYLKQEVMSDRADERTAQYYRDLKRLKEFIDSKGGVKTYIGYEYDCEVIVYKNAHHRRQILHAQYANESTVHDADASFWKSVSDFHLCEELVCRAE